METVEQEIETKESRHYRLEREFLRVYQSPFTTLCIIGDEEYRAYLNRRGYDAVNEYSNRVSDYVFAATVTVENVSSRLFDATRTASNAALIAIESGGDITKLYSELEKFNRKFFDVKEPMIYFVNVIQ